MKKLVALSLLFAVPVFANELVETKEEQVCQNEQCTCNPCECVSCDCTTQEAVKCCGEETCGCDKNTNCGNGQCENNN
jgi:hypothetical protein